MFTLEDQIATIDCMIATTTRLGGKYGKYYLWAFSQGKTHRPQHRGNDKN